MSLQIIGRTDRNGIPGKSLRVALTGVSYYNPDRPPHTETTSNLTGTFALTPMRAYDSRNGLFMATRYLLHRNGSELKHQLPNGKWVPTHITVGVFKIAANRDTFIAAG